MKTVFSNEMVAHIWAQQNQDEGRSNNGQFYFRGKTIYSYRDSWPLAHFHESGFIILNTQSYSMSTSRHLSEVRSALGYGRENIISVDSVEVLKDIVNGYGTNKTIAEKICNTVNDQAHREIKSAAKRKKPALVSSDIGQALHWLSTGEKLCEILKAKSVFKSKCAKLQKQLRDDSAALLASKGDEIKAEREAEKKRQEERKARAKQGHDENLEKFRAGLNYNSYPMKEFTDKVYMRIRPDGDIETSRGAVFPVDHAKKAFTVIHMMKEKGESWKHNGKTIHLGHFQIDEIEPAGNVKAGCHYVEWDEIERCAVALGIYP